MPADDHQVGADGQADQHAARAVAHDILADRHVGGASSASYPAVRRAAGRLRLRWRPGRAPATVTQRARWPLAVCARRGRRSGWPCARCLLERERKRSALASRSPMPMPISWWIAAVSPRTTTTGQDAWAPAYQLTDPSAIEPRAPVPWAPRTSIDAPDPLPVTACAGGSVSICRPGASSAARAAAVARARSRSSRIRSATTSRSGRTRS